MKEHILSKLPPAHPWGQSLYWFGSIGSTNAYAKTLAAQGAPAGTVVIADRQDAGRGRLGRTFQSPAGSGIYMSVILRPGCAPTALMHLTCAVALAVCDAVEKAFSFRPGIKWINDLVVEGRKLGGILTERAQWTTPWSESGSTAPKAGRISPRSCRTLPAPPPWSPAPLWTGAVWQRK